MISLAIIGLGYWGPNLLRAFDSETLCVVKYCCELDAKIRHSNQQLYPHILFTDKFEQVLSDPDLDAVVIATPAPTHYHLAKEALLQQKHVFVEKPLSLKIDHAVELTELADKQKMKLMVGHLMLYHPAIEWLKKAILSGDLGHIYYLYSQRVNLGRIRTQENAMWSLAPHDISMALHLIGKRPDTVSATGYSYLQDQVEDLVFLNLKFPAEIGAHIHCSWLDPHKIRKLTVVGSKKMVVFDDMQKEEPIKVYEKGFDSVDYKNGNAAPSLSVRFGDIWIPHIPAEEPLKRQCHHFIDAIENCKKPLSDGKNGVEVLQILHQAQSSIDQIKKM